MAVSQVIFETGLADFYRFRDLDNAISPSPESLQNSIQAQLYDEQSVYQRYVKVLDSNTHTITLMLEGLTCAACAWLIENQLLKIRGIIKAQVNYTSLTAQISWCPDELKLSEIITAINMIGYSALPYEPREQFKQLLLERKRLLKRIGITAVLGMQVMILSVALYFAQYSGIDPQWRELFYRLGLLFTLPVMIYAAGDFFKSAWTQLLRMQPRMEMPVSLGLMLAFCGSVFATLTLNGDIYYDSVVMFVFLLLVARFYMHGARLKAFYATERLAISLPVMAERLLEKSLSAQSQTVDATLIKVGDWLRILPGQTIAADGVVMDGQSSVNQAIISGESALIKVGTGDKVIAGSLNSSGPLIIEVTATGPRTVLSGIARLAQQSLTAKPVASALVNRVAAWFVSVILLLALVVAVYWWITSPEQWLATTIAVLVVSCPCALSLAMPTAMAAASSTLINKGLLLTNQAALETLTKVTHVVFDKTGTLTDEQLMLSSIEAKTEVEPSFCLQIAASLETHAEHPLAGAILRSNQQAYLGVKNYKNHPGEGVSARINATKYFLGSRRFIKQKTGLDCSDSTDNICCVLATKNAILAVFLFKDNLRSGVHDLLDYFKRADKKIIMLTGDADVPSQALAEKLSIKEYYSQCQPQDKLKVIKGIRHSDTKSTILMIGDGVNDTPVLAAADVSVAVANASPMAISGADIVMVNSSLAALIELHKLACKSQKIIKQNITWALGYNLLAIPFAAAGMIQPFFAALGMSLSSIVVVFNALRLTKPE